MSQAEYLEGRLPGEESEHHAGPEDGAHRSEVLARGLPDALPVLIAYVDRDRRYRFVSAAYRRWFGLAERDLIGRRVEDVVGPDAYRVVGPHLERALAGEPVTWEAEVPYATAGLRWVQVTYTPERDGRGEVVGCVSLVVDVGERKLLEARADQLYRFASAVMAADRLDEVLAAALDAIAGALGARRAAVLTFDDAGVMRFRAWRELSDEYRRAVEGHSPWSRDTVAPRPVLVPDVEAAPELAHLLPALRREAIASLAFVPLVTRGRLLGKFMVYLDQPHAYRAVEVEVAGTIANHLASVIARFEAVARLEETIRYNELFAGVLAHDLRNPLGAMMTAAQIVLMRDEDEGARDLRPLARIVSSGQRMTRMIDQLLDFTRARVGGGIELRPRHANLAELCSQVIAELELAHPDWMIERGVLGDSEGHWDPDRLLQIVSNLVANAGQHGKAGSGILVLLDGRAPEAVSLRVYNKGCIPPALLPSLFDPFRASRHRRDQARGLGLGLFIVKELVRAHGGQVDVTSTEDGGTTFTISLPRQAPPSLDARSVP